VSSLLTFFTKAFSVAMNLPLISDQREETMATGVVEALEVATSTGLLEEATGYSPPSKEPSLEAPPPSSWQGRREASI
jgi:hypothetical protein